MSDISVSHIQCQIRCSTRRSYLVLSRYFANPPLSRVTPSFLNCVQDSSKDSRQAKKAGQYGKSRFPLVLEGFPTLPSNAYQLEYSGYGRRFRGQMYSGSEDVRARRDTEECRTDRRFLPLIGCSNRPRRRP